MVWAVVAPSKDIAPGALAGPTTARLEITRLADRSLGTDRRAHQRTARDLGPPGLRASDHPRQRAPAGARDSGWATGAAPPPDGASSRCGVPLP